jgi:hypothetical protein
MESITDYLNTESLIKKEEKELLKAEKESNLLNNELSRM